MKKIPMIVLLCIIIFHSVNQISVSASPSEPISQFYHIVQFLPPSSELVLNFSMQENEIYAFVFKPETTDIFFNIQISIVSPSGQFYKIVNFDDDCRLNITEHRALFTSYESGIHRIYFTITTNRVMNLKLQISRYSSIPEYYVTTMMPDLSKNNASLVSFYNATMNFNALETKHYLTVEMNADQEYFVDFFRANPITMQEICEKAYSYPRITLWLRIGTVRYLLYENLLLSDQSYHTNRSFTLPFGAHNTSVNTFDFEMTPSAISLNMVFVCYSVDTVARNISTVDPPIDQTKSTSNKVLNGSLLDEWEVAVFNFIDANNDMLIFGTGAAILIAAAVNYYWVKKKPKVIKLVNNLEGK